ncbi:Hypothetical protein SMAX5B_000255 [Scophthalmus maximus]|uniref:Uncharacterized protein n=1 Tax=Scophthalmus maximus TaxID=52904 RepID=A0A2U9CK20_SCOMX|nr:Hypothetical protein SMAX5B_000255 [Scophthalmus maximus]
MTDTIGDSHMIHEIRNGIKKGLLKRYSSEAEKGLPFLTEERFEIYRGEYY